MVKVSGRSSVCAPSVGHLYLAGDGPDKGGHFAGNRDDDLIDLFAPGHQAVVAFAESDLRFPTAVLERLGHLFQP